MRYGSLGLKTRIATLVSVAGLMVTSSFLAVPATSATISGTPVVQETAPDEVLTTPEDVEEFVDDVRSADPEGFEERVQIAQGSSKLNAVLDRLPAEEKVTELEVLAAAIDDPEALQGVIEMYELEAFIPYIDQNGQLQVELDDEKFQGLLDQQSGADPDGAQVNNLDPPRCAAAVGTALAFLAARAPGCYALGVLNPAAGVVCAAGTIAADMVVDWNAACD